MFTIQINALHILFFPCVLFYPFSYYRHLPHLFKHIWALYSPTATLLHAIEQISKLPNRYAFVKH